MTPAIPRLGCLSKDDNEVNGRLIRAVKGNIPGLPCLYIVPIPYDLADLTVNNGKIWTASVVPGLTKDASPLLSAPQPVFGAL